MPEAIQKIDVSVISDFHLATHASKAKSLLKYLKSIQPTTLVLNGDIIDSWRFSRNYFPKSHLKVIRQLVKMIEKGVQVVYITGNHDDVFRKFNNTRLGNFSIVNQLELDINGQKTWIFHGDVFDQIIHHSPWRAKLGAAAYGFLTLFNKFINVFLKLFSGKEMILYKSMKDRILKPVTRNTQQNMKILYAIQGTGNGHLARATEIVPILKSMADTDILVSGTQADLKVPFKIDYQFSGLSFIIGKNGGVDLWETAKEIPVIQFIKDIRSLPVEKYDLVISDFEPVSLDGFTKSFLSCTGLVCTAGFEGPAEAIFMGKKLCVIPMKKQYEQYCNAAFLKSMGIKALDHFTNSAPELMNWIQNSETIQIRFPDMTRDILENILNKHCSETVLSLA